MKTISQTTIGFLLCCTAWLACTKNTGDTPNPNSCAAASPLIFRNGNGYLVLPDAFTPNFDGKNDFFRPATIGIDTANFRLSIIKGGDAVVFQTNNMSTGWGGQTLSGGVAEPGIYEVDIKFRTLDGLIKDTCNYVTLLGTNTSVSPNCIITNGKNYHFEDQIDPFVGFTRPTQEMNCP